MLLGWNMENGSLCPCVCTINSHTYMEDGFSLKQMVTGRENFDIGEGSKCSGGTLLATLVCKVGGEEKY